MTRGEARATEGATLDLNSILNVFGKYWFEIFVYIVIQPDKCPASIFKTMYSSFK